MSTSSGPLKPIEIGPLITRGWQLFTQDAAKHIGFLVAVSLLPTLFIPAHIWPYVTLVIPIVEGSYLYALIRSQGKVPRFADAFLLFNRALPLLLVRWATLAIVFLPLLLARWAPPASAGLGLFLLYIPGFYLLIGYLLAVPLVLDRDTGVWGSLELSRRIISRQWFRTFLLTVVVMLINMIGMIPLGLGLLITTPLTTCILVALYESLIGVSGNFPFSEQDERRGPTV